MYSLYANLFMRLWYPACLALCLACSPTASRRGQSPEEVRSQLDSLDSRFNSWLGAGQVDSIVAVYYAPDATVLVAGSPPVQGRARIRAVYESFYKLGTVRARIQRADLRAADSVATGFGHYDIQILEKSDTMKVVTTDHGSYVTSFVRRGGRWQAIYDSNVSEAEPSAPASAAKK